MARGDDHVTDTTDGAVATDAYGRAKRLFAAAAGVIALGIAVAATAERTLGGGILLAGWALGLVALHRLGRAGGAHAHDVASGGDDSRRVGPDGRAG